MILSDLAKFSMTRSVARSLCDSWASCLGNCLLSQSLIEAKLQISQYLAKVWTCGQEYTQSSVLARITRALSTRTSAQHGGYILDQRKSFPFGTSITSRSKPRKNSRLKKRSVEAFRDYCR